MSIEPQFLSFKGLKQYTPEDGWAEVNAMLNSRTHAPTGAPTAYAANAANTQSPQAANHSVHQAMPNISLDLALPTLTETAEPPAPAARASD